MELGRAAAGQRGGQLPGPAADRGRASNPRPSRSRRRRAAGLLAARLTLAPAAGEGGEPARNYARYVGSAPASRKAVWRVPRLQPHRGDRR